MKVLGVLITIVGILFALYVGIYVMLVGGIIQAVDAFNTTPADSSGVAWGVVRVLFASAVTSVLVWVSVIVGYFVADS